MKSLICGLVILFGATVVWAQEICDEEVYEDVTVTAPDTAMPAPAAPAATPTPPAAPSTTQGTTGETMREHREGGTAMDMRRDVIDTAITNGNLRTFVKALAAADLVATLKGQGPFTIFAPSDEAFANLPAGVLEDLLKPENKSKLARILNNHVLRGQFTAAEVVKMPKTKTIDGREISITSRDGKVSINGVEVQTPDIKGKNGVIHVINAVLLPKE